MVGTGIAHKNSLLSRRVSALAEPLTWVDGMAMVQTPTDGIALHDLIAHGEVDEVAQLC